jgi:hypothetical protein
LKFWQSVEIVGLVTLVVAVAMEWKVDPPSLDLSITWKLKPLVLAAAT